MKTILFIALLLVLAHSDYCYIEYCSNEIDRCNESDECGNVLGPCFDKCGIEESEYNDWNCLLFCVAPARNDEANAFAACSKKNCPQKNILENLLKQ
jgi:hypothetical protein